MNLRSLQFACIALGLAVALGSTAAAQNHGGGGPGGGGHVPSMPTMPSSNPAPNSQSTSDASHHGSTQSQARLAGSASSTAPMANGVQFGPVGRWWDNKSVTQSVGISSEQKRRMDSIFTQNKSAILSSYQNYLKEQTKLSNLSKSPQADQATTFAAIDSVNQARASLQKAAAQMYLQIRQTMTADQLQKLEKVQ